jgi:hypothetical protein
MEKKILKIFIIINALLLLYAFQMPFGKAISGPTIESCDGVGVPKDTFYLNDYVYVKGSDFDEFESYDLYVVEDVTWVDGMAIPTRIPGTPTSVSSLGEGIILATSLGHLDPGKYDILVDFNGDGDFNEGIDALDDSDIQVTAGFFVVPEVPLGTISAMISMTIALIGYVSYRRHRTK